MTKTYKIEKIPEVLGLNYVTLKNKLNEVIDFLEALSDKEEGEECTCDIYCHNGVHMNNCAYEPHHIKKEELKEKSPCPNCPRYPNAIIGMLDKEGNCDRCSPKQSTSLKEDTVKILKNRNMQISGEPEYCAAEILSLVQSHLLKEISQKELEGAWIGENYGDVKQGFEYAKQDIIKIINNLLKIGYITQ